MGASGVSGAYMTEKAERTKKLKHLEKAMLTDMSKAIHKKSHRFAMVFAALVDGFSPAIAALFVVSPFFFVRFGLINSDIAFFLCIGLTLFILVFLGVYLARISDESMIKYGLQMLIVGCITAGLAILVSILLGGSVAI